MDVACIIQARISPEGSCGYKKGDHRINNKMILPFSGKTLLDVTLETIRETEVFSSEQVFLVACEKELIEIGERHGVEIYRRSEASIQQSPTQEEMYRFVWDIPAKHFVQINPCNPLLGASTIDEAVNYY